MSLNSIRFLYTNITPKDEYNLYSKGITTSEISDIIGKMCGNAYYKQTISNITKTMENHVKEFRERQLNKQYIACMDATMFNVR